MFSSLDSTAVEWMASKSCKLMTEVVEEEEDEDKPTQTRSQGILTRPFLSPLLAMDEASHPQTRRRANWRRPSGCSCRGC